MQHITAIAADFLPHCGVTMDDVLVPIASLTIQQLIVRVDTDPPCP